MLIVYVRAWLVGYELLFTALAIFRLHFLSMSEGPFVLAVWVGCPMEGNGL
jgi:hypothetical protein